ncbi:MAG: DUF3883 domain-containing protein [Rhodospirillales bacterium]|nr:DUF3883 domain-containing protein [Rhodospirillales bacterium]
MANEPSTGRAATATTWQPPDVHPSDLHHRYGNSVLLEFIRGHSPAGVLRELIQNEYDADGSDLRMVFGESRLSITGNGKPIDRRGWKRLSVTLGTGSVAGGEDAVTEKQNGIGSKNFGLRSLFLFGDRIYIRSNGRQTLLDARSGVLTFPAEDRTTAGERGVRIEVPYRQQSADGLNAFSTSFEVAVLDEFAERISSLLLKLAQPGTRKGLRNVSVVSVRTGRHIRWTQSVRRVRSARETMLFVRRITMTDSKSGSRELMEEYEWQKSVALPPEFRQQRVPGYFRVPGARIRLGISVRTQRGKPAPDRPSGIAYYPIGIAEARTGNGISISAPFEMDADRSALISSYSSSFNRWLLEHAADLTMRYLRTDWFNRFGAAAYLLVGDLEDSALPVYAQAIENRLTDDRCWPAGRSSRQDHRSVRFAHARTVHLVSDPSLEGFLESSREYLHPAFGKSPKARDLARRYGVTEFTINSLIRLRCAEADASRLQTLCRTNQESDYYYPNFSRRWENLSLQRRCAAALEQHRDRLSSRNRSDLARSKTTLAADSSLAVTKDLWFVPDQLLGICPIRKDQILHPELAESSVLRQLCKPYKAAEWIKEVAERGAAGRADEQERMAVYRYLLSAHDKIPRKTLASIRKFPVLRDSRGSWVPPVSITVPSAAGIPHFDTGVMLPHRDYVTDRALAKALRFKTRITGDDVVRYAETVSRQPDLAEGFEHALKRFPRLLTPSTVDRLATIACIRANDDRLYAPPVLYLPTRTNLACIGPDGPYPAGRARRLYVRLGCRPRPDADAILGHLAKLAETDQAPPSPELLYPELVSAIRRAGQDPASHQHDDIVWTDGRYRAPRDTVLGARWNDIFLGHVPTLKTPKGTLRKAYRDLGVSDQPEHQHWSRFFTSLGEAYAAQGRPLPTKAKRALRTAYRLCQQAGPFRPRGPWLLDDNGHLHTTEAAARGKLVIEDNVPLGRALRRSMVPISFADAEVPAVELFFRANGVQLLTALASKLETRVGRLRRPPHWFREQEYLRKLTDPDFGSALCALLVRDLTAKPDAGSQHTADRLSNLQGIAFAEGIQTEYRVGELNVAVPQDFAWADDVIRLSWVRGATQLRSLLALLIAEESVPEATDRNRLSDGIFRLLSCTDGRDIQEYLEIRGIRWRSSSDVDSSDRATEIADIAEIILAPAREALTSPRPLVPLAGADAVGTEPPEQTPPEAPAPVGPPPVESVQVQLAEPNAEWTYSPRSSPGHRFGGHSGLRGRQNEEQDRVNGRRGEEIIYMLEKKRVREAGHPEEEVVWVSESVPTSDVDIESVDENGHRCFIEVKSTTGTDGNMHWSLAEFLRALREGDRYFLYRVYKVNDERPVILRIRNPVSLISTGGLHLDIASFRAEIQPCE